MADNTISTSSQSCKPDCNQLNIIDEPIMNKYTEIDESPSTDTEEPVQEMLVPAALSSKKLQLHITKMIQNKLKRKKKLSTSLTSVSDAVNQEKRTRIEGIQLNCRGKLNEELIAAATSSHSVAPTQYQQSLVKLERVQSRAPLPSPRVAEKIILLQQSQAQMSAHQHQQQQQQIGKVPPPRLKRKLEENVSTIQKLNAQTEQMRLEIAELKSHLNTERGAVRVLRAQNESESRKWKNEVKKLQTAMELMRKVKKSKDEACANWAGTICNSSSSGNGAKDANITNHELQRLTNEIMTLREANRNLEEKLQISNDAERRKVADLRELKDSYEIRLTQLSKSAKTEISRLLEEIKTKERNIGQLKKETQTLQKHKTNQTTNNNKKDTNPRNASQHPIEMKKLKDIERNRNNNNNNCNVTNKNNTNNEKCFIKTTCGEKEFHSMPHEITERILEVHNDAHAYGSKQDHHQNSDSDSALSSAPPSISPQPPPTGMEPADIWQTIRNYTKDIEKVQNDLESIQKENESLQEELNLAKQQILESEKTAMEATNNAKKQHDRVKHLEQKESELQDEIHELREQNELLEFRILELEESNDKWSLQSNTTPNSKNVWNDGGKETEEGIIFTDRSDSGVTSPHSHHHIDDRINAISPCDLNLLDHMTNEDLRRRLNRMIKKPCIEEEDKICLQQVLAFIQNLDAMSHDSLPSSEESSSLEYIKSRVSDYGSSPRSSDVSPTQLLQKPKSAPATGRIVATVLPYNSTVSTPNDSPQRKLRAWNTSSLTESGVFEGDLNESSVYTQTEAEDFACLESTTSTSITKDLCKEFPHLTRFREKFEDCATKSAYTKVPVPSLPSLTDQKRIQYYKDRLDVLESKLLIYESSGDLQAKRLADRLQKEVQLENLVKELRDRVEFLEVENSQIEEEKCEFEEAENDTRLRLQRLEVELEILSQRNIELEMSREALQNKLKDCRSESAILRDDLSAYQTQVCHLEEDRSRFKENFDFLHSLLPALVIFNAFSVTNVLMGNSVDKDFVEQDPVRKSCDCGMTVESFKRDSQNLREEIRSLKRQISDMNSRHTEALASADGYFEDYEKSFNEQLMASKAKEDSLKQKIKQLEGCLLEDSKAANEKICQLEDAEKELRIYLQKLTRDHREVLQEHGLISEEYHRLRDQYESLREHVDGPLKEALERERCQNKNLKEELGFLRRTSCEQEMHCRNELDCFQVQLDKLHKELLQIQVTNSELREEVLTLEKEIVSLQDAKKEDLDKIRCLSDEVRTKEDMCAVLEKRVEALLSAPYYLQRQPPHTNRMMPHRGPDEVPSLAQELNGSPVKRIKMDEPKDLQTAAKNLGIVLNTIKDGARSIPTHKQFQTVANDVKKLAEAILATKSDHENNIQNPLVKYKNLCKSMNLDSGNHKCLAYPPITEVTDPNGCPVPHIDSEIYYDAFGITDWYPEAGPNRGGTTKNDSYRDHSNISNLPKTCARACQGQQRQPAGQIQRQKTKDHDSDNSEEIWFEQIPSVEYYTPKGSKANVSKPSPKQSARKMRMSTSSVNKAKIYTMGKEEESCEDLSFESLQMTDSANQCHRDSARSDNYSTPKGSYITIIDENESRDFLPEADFPEPSQSDYSDLPNGIRIRNEVRPLSQCSSVCEENSLHSQETRKGGYQSFTDTSEILFRVSSTGIRLRDEAFATAIRGEKPKEHMRYSQDDFIGIPSELRFEVSSAGSWDYSATTSSPEPSSEKDQPKCDSKKTSCTDTHSVRSKEDRTRQILPILENIYEVLQSMRDQQLTQSAVNMQNFEFRQEVDAGPSLINFPPPPSLMDEIFEASNSPFNIFMSPVCPAQTFNQNSYRLCCDVTNSPACANLDRVKPSRVPQNNYIQSMDLLEPPERDLNDSKPSQCERKSQRLIPIDMDLLRNDDEYGWKPFASKECQTNRTLLSDICKATNSKCVGVQVQEDLASCSKIKDICESREIQTHLQTCEVEEINLSTPQTAEIEEVPQSPRTEEYIEPLKKEKSTQFVDQPIEPIQLIQPVPPSLPPSVVTQPVPTLHHLDSGASSESTDSAVIASDRTKKSTDFHYRQSRSTTQSGSCSHTCKVSVQKSNQEMNFFVESILTDLEVMKAVCGSPRRLRNTRAAHNPACGQVKCQKLPPDLSFPVTIEEILDLGPNSLFIKWKVHSVENVAGFEIYVDGILKNRLHNPSYRSAAICEVDLFSPHWIILRATSQDHYISTSQGTNRKPSYTHPAASDPQRDGSVWYPSVFHFEPNCYSSASVDTDY